MTNLDYAISLSNIDMPVIDRVVRTYIEKKVGHDAPLWSKEMAYEEWCQSEFDKESWERARFEMTLSQQNHTGLMNFEHSSEVEMRRKKVKNQMKKWLDALI